MSIYIKLFEVLFPVFFVIGIGYYLGKKNPKIDTTFITSFAANIGTPAMVIYAVTSTGITFDIFKNYFWYYLIAIVAFAIVGVPTLYLIKTKDIIRELPPLICIWNRRAWRISINHIFNYTFSFYVRCFFSR